MTTKETASNRSLISPTHFTSEVVHEQIIWLIQMRWLAVIGMVAGGLTGEYIFPVLISAVPIYICAGILLVTNIIYFCLAKWKTLRYRDKDIILGIIQAEMDMVILTAVLHFSGGTVNPFFMFYIFHVIIAAIILPKNLSFFVGVTAILAFSLLAINELNGGSWLGYYPLQFSVTGSLWRNPVYVLSAFVAFVFMVILAQYLTRLIVVRMTAKEMETAQQSNVLRAVISAMSEGLIFLTHEGKISICNPAANLWKNKLSSDNDQKLQKPNNDDPDRTEESIDDFPGTLREHIKTLAGSTDRTVEEEKNITFTSFTNSYIEAKSCPVKGVGGEQLGYVIVGQNLTEHKKLEQELTEQTEALISTNEMLKMSQIKMAQREKMVAIGQMAAEIAHEIGNPLTSLSSVVQYLSRKAGQEEKEQFSVIEHHISRISNILRRMLSLTRPATLEYKWSDINELIDNTLSLVKFDKRMQTVTVENDIGPKLPMVWLNPQLFEQVLLNIFINALDAMEAKKESQKHVLKITKLSQGPMVEIRISDTGIGMSPEVCKRAFESFFTTKEIGKGTGLGLFISYNVIKEISGTIELESEQGKGTTVIIRIRVSPKANLISESNTHG